ncbi:MAG: hypothetical protein ACOCU4_00960 [Alkalispirochaeta sp.]
MRRPLVTRELTADDFEPFGIAVESAEDGFAPVLVQPDAAGWQVAINRVTTTHLESLHYHPETWECFSPLDGSLAIAVAAAGIDLSSDARIAAKHIAVFRLTTPVCVAPHTWHSLVRIIPEKNGSQRELGSAVFVCENANVRGVTRYLNDHLIVENAQGPGGAS